MLTSKLVSSFIILVATEIDCLINNQITSGTDKRVLNMMNTGCLILYYIYQGFPEYNRYKKSIYR